MAVGFPLYTDEDVLGPLVEALRSAGWDLVRAVELYPQGEDDLAHFERAAKEGRVLVAVDEDQERIAHRWLEEGRPFRGLVTWEKHHERHMSQRHDQRAANVPASAVDRARAMPA